MQGAQSQPTTPAAALGKLRQEGGPSAYDIKESAVTKGDVEGIVTRSRADAVSVGEGIRLL